MQKTYGGYSTAWKKRSGWLLSGLLGFIVSLQAERLPIKNYTTADGLARDSINRIVRDARGYLWFCTEEGLSRFDGYQFTNYTTEHGLPHRRVSDLLETRQGVYWIATANGLCRFDPVAAAHKFTVYRPNEGEGTQVFRKLFEDRAGTVWCGTNGGLFRLERNNGQWALRFVDLGRPAAVGALVEDRRGDLWIGTARGVFRRRPDGHCERYGEEHGLMGLGETTGLLEDRAGRLWVGTRWKGLYRLVPEPRPDRRVVDRVYTTQDGLASPILLSLFQSADGRLWAGLGGGLAEIIPNEQDNGVTFRNFAAGSGLGDEDIWALNEDRDGNLWAGSERNGAFKIARNGFATYTEADALHHPYVGSIFANHAGELYIVAATHSEPRALAVSRFDGKRFISLWPTFPPAINDLGWGPARIWQDRQGEWWFGTGQGLIRFPKTQNFEQLRHTRPKAVYTVREGLATDHVFTLHEDARGDLWMANLWDKGSPSGLTRWERATETFQAFTAANGHSFFKDNFISIFGEDRTGQLWLGLFYGGLARYRKGQFELFTAADGAPGGTIWQIFCDHAGRLWIASNSGGVARLNDPAAERPRFIPYTTAQGLSSDSVYSVTEDRGHRIYLGTGRGLDRLDPVSGRITHYTMADGLPANGVNSAFCDANGALWFGTHAGLVRLVPEPDRPSVPPSIFIRGLRVTGVAHPVSDLGQAEVSGIEVLAHENQFQIDFVGLGFASGETLRYEYKLEGARADWSAPTEQRTIHLDGLAPGSYRFLVRARNADNQISPAPAVVAFTILRPVWQRWWFLMLTGLAVVCVISALYRYRVVRLLELERVRTRIATDLHDDIGSGLSQMAILSEVTKRQIQAAQSAALDTATQIADTARELVDAMSDIVWSIDPQRDDLDSLVQHLRTFVADVFNERGIVWTFETPADLAAIKLNPEPRRQVYLILKEALHNAARHAEATEVWLRLVIVDHQLQVDVQDNGRGFLPGRAPDAEKPTRHGYGLESMKARAAQLGGQLTIDSAPGRGTRISLRLPLH